MLERRVERNIRRRKALITFGMVIICGGILLGVALGSSLFEIKEIKVEKNIFVSSEEVIALSQLSSENIFLINRAKVEEKILMNPYVSSITLRRKLPGTLIIEVEEKKIKGLVKFQNSFINIDSNGKMVHIVNKFPDGKIPLIEGLNVEQYVQNERLIKEDEIKDKALLQVLTIPDYEGCQGIFYSINIEDPYKIILSTKDGVKIDIGDYTELDYKLGFALTLLEDERIKGKKGYIEIFNDGNAVFR